MNRRSFLLSAAGAAALQGQDFSEVRTERVAGGFKFTEGPAWSPDNYLVFSDVPSDKIHAWKPGEGIVVLRDNSNGGNGNTFDSKGSLYTCESRTRRVIRQTPKGEVEVVAESYNGQRLNAPNDIVIRKDGHIYFTDPAFGAQADHREMTFYGVYHIPPKGPMELIAQPKGRPNGIELSPDGRILYVANSDERKVYAYDVDRNSKASNERVFCEGVEGPPDGMAMDEKGNLYVTCNTVAVYSPQGKLLHSIPIPETPRNCAFGDPDLQTLYVTALTTVYRCRMPVKGFVQYW